MVGISLLTLVPGVFGGSATYASELIRTLARTGELEYRVFTPTIAPDAADGLPSKVVTSYRASRTIRGRILAMGHATVRGSRVRKQLEPGRLDAIHFPLNVMLPRVGTPPAATTVHDVLHRVYPRFFSRSELAYRRIVFGWTYRLSRLLIAPSAYSASTLTERFDVDPERVRVIHHGIDFSRFRPAGKERGPFLLYPAAQYPHKNHRRLLEAFALLRRERPELRLVLAGFGLEGRPLGDGVDVYAHVSPERLAELYQTASVVVFPSLHETFGFPPLEAMACGCPVAVSKVGSLPEVCGEAARYFDPTSVEDIAAAVLDALARSEELVQRGLANVTRFRWEESARRHEAVYRELHDGA